MPYCPACGKEAQPTQAYCMNCGASLGQTGSYDYSSRPPYQTVGVAHSQNQKNPVIAAGLALVLGIFGLWGIGHMYAGRVGMGIGLLVTGLIIAGLIGVSVILTAIFIGYFGILLFGLLFLAGWLWQAYDAYRTAERYNWSSGRGYW
jgi:TM2 domain-containing membrane protein YozV